MKPATLLCLIVLGTFSVFEAQAQQTPRVQPFNIAEDEGVFLIITDIHFDPFANPDLVPMLDEAPVENWLEILSKDRGTTFADYGSDTNFPLMMSALQAAATRGPSYDYVIYAGDYLAHNFAESYAQHAGPNAQGHDTFAVKTISFVNMMMRQTLGNVPIYGAFGNNDSLSGDYRIHPLSPLLDDVADQWNYLTNQPERLNDFTVGGFYKVAHPTIQDHDIIILNNVFWSTRYPLNPDANQGDPGAAQMDWLEWQLYDTQVRGRTAEIVMHIPPGIDAFSVLRSAQACENSAVSFWKDAYTQQFLEMAKTYSTTITSSIAGHAHHSDFRVISDDDGSPYFATRIVPSVSPIFGNNPAFSYVLYDKEYAKPNDYATLSLTNLEDVRGGETPNWELEYVFSTSYQQADLSPASIAAVAEEISTSEAAREDFIKYYSGGTAADNPITDSNWQTFSCAQTNITRADYIACLCQN
ncbi:hypothetical protein GCM10007094_14970 [Pseudovibrio japonicus]|uniref:Sphingomyelin phosphodiesterase C-terminal domain-containing protein n=1 Tax=Pseudovibrio japonicus TaxID=366534 RepID=A0ABQ3E7K5_9HYPH|nr:metallophosphoesterase [Pseudovibrio japonicus]GHB27640.1 hypothetical protein GCM10007094_14970 [Pseudovibrio japonicus]